MINVRIIDIKGAANIKLQIFSCDCYSNATHLKLIYQLCTVSEFYFPEFFNEKFVALVLSTPNGSRITRHSNSLKFRFIIKII